MSTIVRLTALDVPLTVDVTGLDRAQLDRFLRSWESCKATVVDDGGDAEVVAVLADAGAPTDGRAVLLASTYSELADRVTSAVTLRAIEARRTELLMLHAGAVAEPSVGTVVAFIGPSGRGKTTASVALGRHFSYVTDETVGIRDNLAVVPYPKPLSIKQPSEPWKKQTSPAELGLGELTGTELTLSALIMLDRQADYPEDAAPHVERISLSDAIEDLVPQISYLTERVAPLRRLRDVIAVTGGLLRVTYREADTLVPVVAGLLGRKAPVLERHEYVREEFVPSVGGIVQRGDVDDFIEEADEIIVLKDSTVRVLGGIAPTIWNALPATIDDLVDAVVAVHGEPPTEDGAFHLVDLAVRELAIAGMLDVSA